jgi:hypothetical protein
LLRVDRRRGVLKLFTGWEMRVDEAPGVQVMQDGCCDRGRNYATTTTMFPSFRPVSAYL